MRCKAVTLIFVGAFCAAGWFYFPHEQAGVAEDHFPASRAVQDLTLLGVHVPPAGETAGIGTRPLNPSSKGENEILKPAWQIDEMEALSWKLDLSDEAVSFYHLTEEETQGLKTAIENLRNAVRIKELQAEDVLQTPEGPVITIQPYEGGDELQQQFAEEVNKTLKDGRSRSFLKRSENSLLLATSDYGRKPRAIKIIPARSGEESEGRYQAWIYVGKDLGSYDWSKNTDVLSRDIPSEISTSMAFDTTPSFLAHLVDFVEK